MPLVRDTINPLNERDVSDEEALDLDRMGIRLTGTRAKTPDGLRAAAVRQVSDQLEGTAPASAPAPAVPVEDVEDVVVDDDDDQADDPQTPGDPPDSTTDDTSTDSQES